ncbi:MAG TPA: hypothetical protein VK202_12480 [Bacteroidia bacterium]|nr:hypothetical protein [Bacteroidia bacterium]
MSTDNSTRPDLHAIAMLFDEPLIVHRTAVTPEKASLPQYTGANQKGLVFLRAVADTRNEILDQLLNDIIVKGLKYTEDDCALITWDNDFGWNELKSLTSVKHLVLFGVEPQQLGIRRNATEKYVPFFTEDTQVITADSLQKISDDVNVKKKFWQALQTILKK